MYKYDVSFYERGYWTKRQPYISTRMYDKYTAVVVPVGSFYAVGRIMSDKQIAYDPTNLREILGPITDLTKRI